MKSERRTQLEKFNAKYMKDTLDIESMLRAELDKKQSMLNTVTMANEKVLCEKGNIAEAAAVMTQTGLEMFGASFGNSVSTIFREEAIPMIRSVIREEIRAVISGIMIGYKTKLEDEVKSLITDIALEDLIAPESDPEKETTPTIAKESKPAVSGRGVSKTIANKLAELDGPVTLSELRTLLPEVKFRDSTMQNAKQAFPEIVSAGYGKYAYNKLEKE